MTEQDMERVARAIAPMLIDDLEGTDEECMYFINSVAKAALSAMPNTHEKALAVAREALEHYAKADDGAYQMMAGFKAKTTDKCPNSIANKALATIDEIVGK